MGAIRHIAQPTLTSAEEVGEHEDVEQFGAWSGAERIEASPKPALQLVGSHCRRLRRRTVARHVC
jgi:hypothetical protein